MVTKLNNTIREHIKREVLEHKFKKEVAELVSRQKDFTMKVYNIAYSSEEQEKMAALPKGWLPVVSRITLSFGSGYHNTHSLEFSGTHDLGKNTLRLAPNKDHPGKMVPYDHYHQHNLKLTMQHELVKEVAAFDRERSALEEKIKLASGSLETALQGSTTVNALITKWPEIASFAKKYDTGDVNLPALPYQHLNQMLDLPA